MKIAIVGPSPVPFGIGGMEYLLWGLQDHINDLTEHKAELIKLPSKENGFWELIDSYKQFYYLDLSHFDKIITTKYPAWMVQHPNQICYMAHRLRGLYDTYHFMKLPEEPNRNNPWVNKILDYIDSSDATIDGMFSLLEDIALHKDTIPNEHFAFPGPFIRKIIHFLDTQALKKANKFYAISKTVKSRKEYFPEGAQVEVVYPPSFLPAFKQQGYDNYIFTISRLDGAKRISLIIEAMKHVKSNIHLKIAGTGPDEQKLKEMAKGDPRIEFLGFVNDKDAIEYYSNAKGVIYIPYEEDYGLVTIEAMMSKKPVITCYDSGGTTEFVEQGITGFISHSTAEAIGNSINELAKMQPQELLSMGNRCFDKVKGITWQNVASSLTNENQEQVILNAINKPNSRKKITVASTFAIYPPQGGGQSRTYNLFKSLGEYYNIEIVSFTHYGEQSFSGKIADHLVETRIPKSTKHQEEESKLERQAGVHIADIGMSLFAKYTPEYEKALKKAVDASDLVVISHPFLIEEAKKHLGNKPFIYDAQDVEYMIKKELLKGNNTTAKELIDRVYKLEKYCCENSQLIMTCSQEDKDNIIKLYQVNEKKIVVVPNGVDITSTGFTDVEQRLINKRKMNLHKQKIGMFMGSWHPPNLEACEYIFEIAKKCPDVIFLLAGSQCLYFKDKALPANIGLLGIVSEEEKNRVFETVDFALNPMLSGSGTNLKMFDYMAAGIPIITTEFGTRGIANKKGFIISDIHKMDGIINAFDIKTYKKVIKDTRAYVKDEFDWVKICRDLIPALEGIE